MKAAWGAVKRVIGVRVVVCVLRRTRTVAHHHTVRLAQGTTILCGMVACEFAARTGAVGHVVRPLIRLRCRIFGCWADRHFQSEEAVVMPRQTGARRNGYAKKDNRKQGSAV